MLDLVQRLINELNKNNIKYCHWKSNINLNKAISGYDDLDLLVAKKDLSRFESAILSLNFKLAANNFISFPGTKHFYGCDAQTGEIVHLHVYYKIITGPSLTKSYAFDIENMILNNHLVNDPSGMPIPQRYVEFVIYMIRTMTKFARLYEHILASKNIGNVRQEMSYLYNEKDDGKIEFFLQAHFPLLGLKFLKECMSAIIDQNHIRLFYLGKKLCRKIDKYKRLSRCNELTELILQLLYRTSNKLFFHQKKRYPNGGIMIAVVGADATGKTTISNELYCWLSKNFTAHLIHAGKPPSTPLTYLVNLSIRIVKLLKRKGVRGSIQNDCKLSLPLAVRLLTLAYDRMKLIRKFWQKSISGDIIICDRYPSANIGVMDSQRMQPTKVRGLKKILASWEQQCYESIPKPDIVLQLYVPVEIAIERNNLRNKTGKENEEFIRLRHKENRHLSYEGGLIYSIDTSQKYDEVIGQLKRILWQNL